MPSGSLRRPLHYNVISSNLPEMTLKPMMRHLVWAAGLWLLPSLAAAQEPVVTPPPSLTVEGIPPIPQSIADGLARYSQFRQAQMQAWHPSKRQVIIRTALGNAPQLHLVEGPARDRRQLTWFRNGVHSEVSPSFDPADPNTFVFLYDPANTEGRSIYKYDTAAGESTLVASAKARYPAIWARQGRWLAYDSAERNGKDHDIYVIQPSDPKTKRLLTQVENLWSAEDWSPDGSTLLLAENFSNTETYLWRVDVKTGEKTPVTRRGDGKTAAWY